MEDLLPPAGDGGVADHGVATSMQVVVKAANQKYNDQTIECQGSWTVKKLKAHLAEVYPCKPRENQQKIIFSGRLLQDHLVLKDVLRSFDPDCPTTVHLVCSPGVESKEPSPSPEASGSAMSAAAPVTSSSSSLSSGVRRRTTAGSASTSWGNTASGTRTTNTTTVSSVTAPIQVPSSTNAQPPQAAQYPSNWNMDTYNAWMQQYYANFQQQPPSGNSAAGPGGDYQNMYQQYWQYYMYMQYAQYMQAAQTGSLPTIPSAAAPAAGDAVSEDAPAPAAAVAQAEANNNEPANAAAAAAGAAQPPVVGAAGAGGAMFEDEEDEGRNRDWLDWLYVGSRLGVLLSIIYFYSTVGRFMLVFGFCFLVYIVRNHLYANRNNRNRRNNVVDVGAAPPADAPAAAAVAPGVDPAAAAPPQAAPEPAPADAGVAEEPARAAEDRQEDAEEDLPQVAPQPEGPSAWSVVVTIVTTFFSSLVPQPPAN